ACSPPRSRRGSRGDTPGVRRRLLVCASVALVAAPCALSAPPGLDFATPGPAQLATARLAIASGSGERRLAIWTATNAAGELCLGWQLGASTAPPAGFTCLRRGLERPVLPVEGRGGLGTQ